MKYYMKYMSKPPLFSSEPERQSRQQKPQTAASYRELIDIQKKKTTERDDRHDYIFCAINNIHSGFEWGGGGTGMGCECQLLVEILSICQLLVEFFGICQLTIKSTLISTIERKYCLMSTSYLAGLFDIFILLHI